MSRWVGVARNTGIVAMAFCLASAAKAPPASGVTAILGATVFTATGEAPRVANVVIRDGRIVAVGPAVRAPRGATVIQAKGQALLPGFFDLHTHWTPAGAPNITPEIANAYIAAGVTTVNDFHQSPESWAPRRAWLATLAAPHVNFTARTSTPGGHGADWADVNTTKWVNTPEAARQAIRELVPYKPDVIKAFHDGWRYGTSADNTSMDEATLAALVDEAHKNDWKVGTHTVTVERGRAAGRAKVDFIAHSLQDREIDAETVAALKQGGTAYAPTLAVYEPVKPGMAPPENPDDPRFRQSVRKFGFAMKNVKALHDAGVPIALGTDAGMPNTPHGVSTLREMELLVQAGLTPTQALMAGTANSAKVLDVLADRGTIAAGKRADLVLVEGRPWENISDVRRTVRVFVDGKAVHGPGVVLPKANSERAMPPVKVAALIDDFERPDGRTQLDTLRVDDMDGGIDRTVQVSQVIDRAPVEGKGGGKALSLAAKMAVKSDPQAAVVLPLTRGSVQPADARAFRGVRFEARGDGGPYRVMIDTLNGRWAAEVTAGAEWRRFEVPFTEFQRVTGRGAGTGPWTGTDLTEVEFAGSRKGGGKLWLELDNVAFY
ncbi:amidohydrolase family protein [Phenylobacterium sp. J426]|uniref:amidohydrolase family protein n=1 Tax=Phenylobacterium sp. J426 TaxID=2898439 RepID=UPI0021517A8E|nr:amidohydrolase family protein [Phenylobacterium sp. J426]MCR5873864.1 amidohydrolase family protein [Phenylobacterium sp. J426]